MRSFTLASCALYFLTGLTSISIGSVMPQLLNYYQVSYTIGGQLIFTGSIGYLSGVLIASWLNNHFRPQPLLSTAALIIAVSQFSIMLLPPLPLFMIFFFLNSIGNALIGIVVATTFLDVFTGSQAVAMSYLEVAFGLGSFIMPILAGVFIALDSWRFLFLLTTVMAVLLAFMWTRIVISSRQADASVHARDASSTMNDTQILTPALKWSLLGLFAFIVFLYGGLEGSLNNFMSSIFINYLQIAAYYAPVSVGIFWGAMVIGRALTGVIIRKMTYSRYLTTNICGAILALCLFIMLKSALFGYVLVALLGLMMSGIYSITLVYANHSIPNSAHLVTPVIAGLCGLGAAVLPAFTGFLIDRGGMLPTLWYIAGIATAYLTFLLCINRMRRRRGHRPVFALRKAHAK